MFFGDIPVSVDYETALYILRQKECMPQGKSWSLDFPAVINHTSTAAAKKHPDFEAAKKGDFDAAIRLVNDLVKNDKVLQIAKSYPNAHIIYNHRMKGTGINMIPAAYAARFSAIGMIVEHNVIGITNVSHTGASDLSRICKRMRYEGAIIPGADYILLDDFITSGAEIRDLKDYVESKAGHVVLISTLGHGSYSKLSDIRIDTKYKDKLRFLGITDQVLRKYGIATSTNCLTLGEAAKLSRVVDTQAKKQLASNCSRVQHIDQREQNSEKMDSSKQQSRIEYDSSSSQNKESTIDINKQKYLKIKR